MASTVNRTMRVNPHARRALGMVLVVGFFLASCGTSGGDRVAYWDPDLYTRFEVPSNWQLYEPDDLGGETVPFVAQGADFTLPVVSRVAFEGSSVRDVGRLSQPVSMADFPIGSSVVRTIGSEERDLISRYVLAEVVVPYHDQVYREVTKEDVDLGSDFEGVQSIILYTEETTEENAGVFFVSVTNPEVTRLYSIAVGCSLDCFNQYQAEITEVVDSWLVNTRD